MGKPFRTWNRFNLTPTNLIAAPLGLIGPKLINAVDLTNLQALHEPISQARTRLARQRERLPLDFINGHGM
jgi:hypothetical protein